MLPTSAGPRGTTTSFAGDDDTSSGAAFLTDSTANWTVNELVGQNLVNQTDGSSCTVTSNGTETVSCTLTGGDVDLWNSGDEYIIQMGTVTNAAGIRVGTPFDGNGTTPATATNTYSIWITAPEGTDPSINFEGDGGADNVLKYDTSETEWFVDDRFNMSRGATIGNNTSPSLTIQRESAARPNVTFKDSVPVALFQIRGIVSTDSAAGGPGMLLTDGSASDEYISCREQGGGEDNCKIE